MHLSDLIDDLERKFDKRLTLSDGYTKVHGNVTPIYFNKEGKNVGEKVDINQGILIHGEIPRGGENYDHAFYFYDGNDFKEIFKLSDDPNYKITKMVNGDDSASFSQMWNSFPIYHQNPINEKIMRRFNEIIKKDDFIMIPYNKSYDCGDIYDNFGRQRNIEGEDGLVVYDLKNGSLIWVDKSNNLRNMSRFNLKEDQLKINGNEIDKNDHIDFLGKIDDKIIYDSIKVIDLYYPGQYEAFCKNANPFTKEGGSLERIYKKNQVPNGTAPGPQTNHTIKAYNLKNGSIEEIKSFSDPSRAPYYWYVEPGKLQQGIISVIARNAGEKFDINLS